MSETRSNDSLGGSGVDNGNQLSEQEVTAAAEYGKELFAGASGEYPNFGATQAAYIALNSLDPDTPHPRVQLQALYERPELQKKLADMTNNAHRHRKVQGIVYDYSPQEVMIVVDRVYEWAEAMVDKVRSGELRQEYLQSVIRQYEEWKAVDEATDINNSRQQYYVRNTLGIPHGQWRQTTNNLGK